MTGGPGGGTLGVFALANEDLMFGLGATELGIILVIIVILFGARRLPEIGSGVGKAIKNFKAGLSGKDEIDVTPETREEETDGNRVGNGKSEP